MMRQEIILKGKLKEYVIRVRKAFNHLMIELRGGGIMARCSNCKYKWKFKDVLSLGFSKSGKGCLNCGHTQYISARTQRLFTLGWLSLIFVPFIVFRIKLSNKEEGLF